MGKLLYPKSVTKVQGSWGLKYKNSEAPTDSMIRNLRILARQKKVQKKYQQANGPKNTITGFVSRFQNFSNHKPPQASRAVETITRKIFKHDQSLKLFKESMVPLLKNPDYEKRWSLPSGTLRQELLTKKG